jgi:hypothetical protein
MKPLPKPLPIFLKSNVGNGLEGLMIIQMELQILNHYLTIAELFLLKSPISEGIFCFYEL